MLTGAGIGGEYAAVNATIQELIPARRRGFTDLVVNGSFWLGAALGAIGALVVLDPAVMPAEYGWRVRLHHRRRAGLHRAAAAPLPAGKPALADDARPAGGGRTRGGGDRAARGARDRTPAAAGAAPGAAAAHATCSRGSGPATRALFTDYRRRTVLGVALMAAQAFCYNAVFFTYALILTAVLRGPIGRHRLVHAAVRGRQFPRAAGAGQAVRHAGTAADDHRHLRAVRRPDGADRLAVRARRGWTRCSRRWPGR